MANDQKKLDKISDAQRQREKERRRGFKKAVDRSLLHSDFNTASKKAYNARHKRQIP